MNALKKFRSSMTGLLLLAGVAGVGAQPISFSVLHHFKAGNNDGASPYSDVLLGADGILYGTTWSGGTNSAGTIFRMNSDGGGFAILHHFGAGTDGTATLDSVIQGTDGFLYGTTYYGGTNGDGTIFKINTNGLSYSVIYSFADSPDGANPNVGLVQGVDGRLYGTTSDGGIYGQGTVFKIATNGSQYIVLHSFTNFTDATDPSGRLVQASNGMLYGTTYSGGPNLAGTVFQINTNGSNYAVLHGFDGVSDGFSPESGLLVGRDGWLYGTTVSGGASGFGTVFKLNTNGGGFQVLRNFTNSPDGEDSYARLVQGNDGLLYGTTADGGYGNNGGIFRLDTNGANYSILYRFGGPDGSEPMTELFPTGEGMFYGTTLMGGTNGFGTIFRLTLVPTLNLAYIAPSAPLLTLSGFAGQPVQVQVSSNLINWTTMGTLSLTNGSVQVPDVTAANSPVRFYRAFVP